MATTETNLADRSGNLVESHRGYDPRIVFFYFVVAGLFVILIAGLGYQQLHQLGLHSERERKQNQRRIVIPGPRGNIYDRHGTMLVTNSPRWTVVLHLEELRTEFYREQIRVAKNYRAMDEKDVPSKLDLAKIARVSVAQRYLDQVNRILHRDLTVNAAALQSHFRRELLRPFTLLDGLDDADYARLIERLPVNSPLQVYATSVRNYVFGASAVHALGRVRTDTEIEAEDLPGADLQTFKMHGASSGILGLEKTYDAQLQGQAGSKIIWVDPSGYKINRPVAERAPKQGGHLVTSLDIDLQRVAEEKIAQTENEGSAVAIDIATGEVLALASLPNYNPNDFYPRIAAETYEKIREEKAEFFRAVSGSYPPGSTFKILVTIAGLRSGKLDPEDTSIDCNGVTFIGRSRKTCDNGHAHHGRVDLSSALSVSCDIYYYQHGIDIGPRAIAAEARRFRLDQPPGIDLAGPAPRLLIPDPDWKRATVKEPWTDGDTANMAIGQGYVLISPLQMACFAASVARNETVTIPTLIHDANRPRQRTEPLGLTAEQRAVLIEGMKGVITKPGGTAYATLNLPSERVPGVEIAGKTGTAEYGAKGDINIAWFVCFAPADKPEIAVAVAIRSNEPGDYGGGRNAGPVATAMLRQYFERKANPSKMILSPFPGRKP